MDEEVLEQLGYTRAVPGEIYRIEDAMLDLAWDDIR